MVSRASTVPTSFLKADKMLNIYAKRWKIETFYRDAKQELGMEDYEMRKIEGVMRHFQWSS